MNTGRQSNKTAAAGMERHAVKIRMGLDGFSLEIRSGNSLLIFAIITLLILTFVGMVVLMKAV